jgi:hypothetical protein
MSMQDRIRIVRVIARREALFCVLAGFVVLFGWIADIGMLQSILPGEATMKVNTALCFILSGFAVRLLLDDAPKAAVPLVALVTAIAAATLAEYLYGTSFGIDNMLVQDKVGGAYPGRMAPASAFAFLLFGMSIFAHLRRMRDIFFATTVVMLLMSMLGIAGYLVHATDAFAIGSYTTMAFPTAVTLLVLTLATMSLNLEHPLSQAFLSDRNGGAMHRRLLVPLAITPGLLAWLQLQGQYSGWYGQEFGLAVTTVVNTVIVLSIVAVASVTLNRLDEERIAEEAALQAKIADGNARIKELASGLTVPAQSSAFEELQQQIEQQSEYIVLIEERLKKSQST